MFSHISIDKEKLNFVLAFEYDSHVVAELKSAFPTSTGRKYNPDDKLWLVPIREENLSLVLDFAENFGFDLRPEAREEIERIKADKKEFISLSYEKENHTELKIPGFEIELFPYQKSGVVYAVKKSGVVLFADEMGLGKTFQSLAAMEMLSGYPLLIVCPASLKYQWQAEIAKALPEKSVFVVNGRSNNYETLMSDIIIINYEILESNLKQLLSVMEFRGIIFDEGYKIKNHKAKRTLAAKSISEKCKYRMILNGTPISNHPIDLISQLDILGLLDNEFGGFFPFARQYCAAVETQFGWDFSGASNLAELNNKLRALCMIRRNQKDVLPELPPILRTVIPVELSNFGEYWQAEKQFLEWLRLRLEDETLIPAEMKKALSEIADSETRSKTKNAFIANKISRANNAEAIVKLNALRILLIKGKQKAIKEFLEGIKENEQKAIVFYWHTEPLREMNQTFFDESAGMIYGEIPAPKRDEFQNKFQTEEKYNFLIGNLNAMGYGLNLTAARHVVFAEMGWTPGEHSQAEKRAHRIGTDHPVNVWYILAKNTVEEKIYNILAEKRNINREALGDTTEEIITGDTEGTVAAELIAQYLKTFAEETK